jgi:predicted enzyme related to lactoylglutathione lyase
LAKAADPLSDFKQRAKRLLKRVREREPEALEEARIHPLMRGGVDPEQFALSDAQLAVARQQGFESWPRLVAAQSKESSMSVIFNGVGMRIWALPGDFTATADFYRDILDLKCSFRDDVRHVAIFELGFGPTLVLEGSDANSGGEREKLCGRITGICLGVADVADSYQALKERSVEFLREPEKQYWGGVMAHFKDPAGNWLTLLQQTANRNRQRR